MKRDEGKFQGVWTLGEQRDGDISTVSYELLAWGRELADKRGTTLASVILGHNIEGKAESLIHHGADTVYVVDHPGLEHFTPDVHAAILEKLVREFMPEIFIASATTYGRTVMPVLAARIETGLTADCTVNLCFSKVEFIEFIKDETTALPIQETDIIVSGSKWMKDAKNFNLIHE